MIATFLLVLSLPLSAPEPSRAGLVTVLVAHAAAQAADVITTRRALSHGHGVEANPLMRPFAGSTWKLALVKSLLVAGISAALWKLHAKHPRVALIVGGLMSVGTGYVAYRNAGVGR